MHRSQGHIDALFKPHCRIGIMDYITPMYLMKAARIAIRLEENQKALDYLKRIESEFSSSTEASQVEVLIGMVEAKL